MTQRELLRLLVAGPRLLRALPIKALFIAEPAAALAAVKDPALLAGRIGPWEGVRWVVKTFDRTGQVGVALEIRNRESGERSRNAVRLLGPALDRDTAETARLMLGTWAEGVAGHPVPLPREGLLNPCGDYGAGCLGAGCRCGAEAVGP